MENTLIKNYSSAPTNWNALKKTDYILITSEIKRIVGLYIEEDSSIDIDISISSNGDSTYTPEEFEKYFSNESAYKSVNVTAYAPNGMFVLTFNNGSNEHQWVYMNSKIHTLPQIEDILQCLVDFIVSLFNARAPKEDLTQSNKSEVYSSESTPSNEKTPFYHLGWFWGAVGVMVAIGIAILQKFNVL